MGANTSLTQLGNGREHVQGQSKVGCGRAIDQLRVERRKKHNAILDYDFHVMAFKWRIFLENHDLSIIICDFFYLLTHIILNLFDYIYISF